MTRHIIRFASVSTILALVGTAIVFSACGRIGKEKVKADTGRSDLLGPVRTVRSETASLVDGMGNPIREQKGLAEESNYDPNGFETDRSLYTPDGSLLSRATFGYDARRSKSEALLHDPKGTIREKKVFKTDERGNVVEWQNTRPDGSVQSKSSYVYDDRGNNTGRVVQNARGAVTDKWVYGYDDRGRVIAESRYYADGALDQRTTHELDDKGLRKESATYGTDGSLVEKQRYDYEFDSAGNWIKMTTSKLSAKPGKAEFVRVSVAYRAISYY